MPPRTQSIPDSHTMMPVMANGESRVKSRNDVPTQQGMPVLPAQAQNLDEFIHQFLAVVAQRFPELGHIKKQKDITRSIKALKLSPLELRMQLKEIMKIMDELPQLVKAAFSGEDPSNTVQKLVSTSTKSLDEIKKKWVIEQVSTD